LCFLDVVTTFERIVFQRIDNALGEAGQILKTKYPGGARPFPLAAEKFLQDKEKMRLADAQQLLNAPIPQGLREDLREVVNERNRLAHGGRFVEPPAAAKSLDEIVRTLEDLLRKHNINV